ncbi:tyrosine-type recombinase/integrase [Shewanella frigidimarina]|uniref:tyrosine-type recombinase/integrase n=1 Tax=Shewanella frigidimarina TaxID=56812 RepID=UPI003D7B0CF8
MLQTETQKIPHTFQRNGIYYLRYRVPKAIQQMTGLPAVVRQSLQKKSPEAAKKLTNIVVSKICELKGVVMAKELEMTFKMNLMTVPTIIGDVKFEREDPNEELEMAVNFMLNNPHLMSKIATPKIISSSISLSEAMSQYVVWRDLFRNANGSIGISHKSKQARQRNFEILLHIIGDISITEITRPQIREALDIISNMPVRNKNPYAKDSLTNLIKAAKERAIPEEDLVSTKQAAEALKDYQSLFSRFLTETKELLKKSPTKGVKHDFESISYAALTERQMRLVTEYWNAQVDSDYKWIILLGAYTGARRGDIFNLKLSSVKFDIETKRYYLLIEEGKTKAANRKIPIHKKLINIGFLSFVEKMKLNQNLTGKLFRSFKSDHYITSKFRSSLDILGIPKQNEEHRRLSFHSLRHSVITKSITDNHQQCVQKVVGHEILNSGITKVYIGNFELSSLLNVIDCLDW